MANITNDIRFIRLPSVQAKVGLSRSQIYKLIDEGRFPAQVRLFPKSESSSPISIAKRVAQRLVLSEMDRLRRITFTEIGSGVERQVTMLSCCVLIRSFIDHGNTRLRSYV